MIKLENIEKIFRTEEVETVALNSVSLEVKQGEFVAVMGPSGCGKSTLLNILGLLDNPTNGTYVLDGENVGQLKESQRTRVRKGQIGFVFQSFNSRPSFSATVVGRSAAACGHSPCRGLSSQADSGRRAYG